MLITFFNVLQIFKGNHYTKTTWADTKLIIRDTTAAFEIRNFSLLFLTFPEKSFGFKEFIFWVILLNLCDHNCWSCFTSKNHLSFHLSSNILFKTFLPNI